MTTRVITLQELSGKMLDEIFRKKPTFKEIYPKIDADTIQIVKGVIEIDTNRGVKKRTVEMWVDEEAKLKGRPMNKRATMMYQYYWYRNKKQLVGDTINGTVAVIIPKYEQFEVDSL